MDLTQVAESMATNHYKNLLHPAIDTGSMYKEKQTELLTPRLKIPKERRNSLVQLGSGIPSGPINHGLERVGGSLEDKDGVGRARRRRRVLVSKAVRDHCIS